VARELVTRGSLSRELVLNAATKPVAILTAAGVAVAAFVLGALWLLLVAVVLYGALFLITLFDAEEAARVGQRAYGRARGLGRRPQLDRRKLSPRIAELLDDAQTEEGRIRQAIDQSDLPLTDVSVEVDRLMADTERIAQRAQLVETYLSEQDPAALTRRREALRREGSSAAQAQTRGALERARNAVEEQLRVYGLLDGELDRFYAEMEHLNASLAVVHGQVVRMSVAEESSLQEDVASQVRDLRERVGTLAGGIDEALGQLDSKD
jgi:hypothetical protein